MVTSQLVQEVIDSQAYWRSDSMPPANEVSQAIYLLPNYDEYTVGYTDRSAIFDVSDVGKFDTPGNVLNPTIVLDGRVVGTWKRTFTKNTVHLAPKLFTSLTRSETHALSASAVGYGAFLNMPVKIDINLS